MMDISKIAGNGPGFYIMTACRGAHGETAGPGRIPHVRLHDLRHSVATLLADEKINTKVTAELLGHSDPAFTMRQYVHSTPDMQREAAELIAEVLQTGLKQVQEGV